MSILKGDIYWVDRNLENIFKASKLPKQVASPEIVKTGLQKLRDIVLVDRQNQPLDKMNPCYKSGNGNCEQLCFSYPSDEKPSITRKCECAFGSLQNGRKCAVSEEHLVFSTPGVNKYFGPLGVLSDIIPRVKQFEKSGGKVLFTNF